MASTTNKQPLANKKKKSKKPSSSSSSSSSSSFPTMTTPVVGSSSASSSKSQKKSKSQQPRAQHASTTTTTTPATMSTSSISDSEDESTTPSTTTTKSSSSSVPFSTSTAAVNKLKTMFANKTNRSLIKILPSSSSRMDQYPSTQQSQQKVSSSSASTTTNKKKKKNGRPATTSSSSTAKKTTKKTKTSEAYDGEEEEYDYDDEEEEEEEEEYDDGNEEEEEDDENNDDDDDDDDSENEEDNITSATSTAPAASSSSLTTTTTTTTVINTASNTSDTMIDSANGNGSGSGSSGVGSSSSHSADKSQLVMMRCACCGQQVSLESAPFHVGNEVLKEWYLKVFPHVAAKRDDRACNKCYRKVSRMRRADPEAAEASAAATAAASVPSTAPASNSAPSTVDSQAASAGNTVKATPPKSKKSSSQSTSNSGSKRPRDSPGIDTFFPKKPKVTTVQESPVPAARSSVPSHAQATTIETAVLIPDSDEVMECPQTPGEPTEVEVVSDTTNDSSVITTNAITVAPDRLIRTDILLEFRRQAAPTNDYVHMVPIFNASPSLPDFINVIQEAWRGLPKRAGDTENFSFIRLQRAVKDFSGEIAYVDMLNSNVFEIYPIRQLEKFVVLQPALES